MKDIKDMKEIIVINTQKKSMKSWIWVILIVIALFLIVGFLDDQGYLNVKWQGLAIILAAIAGPYKLLKNYIEGGSAKSKQILEKHKKVAEDEKIHREVYDQEIERREKEIEKLETKVKYLDKKIEKVREEQKEIPKEVENLTLDETKNEFLDLYGE